MNHHAKHEHVLVETHLHMRKQDKILSKASDALSGSTKLDTWTSQGSSTSPRSAHVAAVVGLHRCPPLRRRRTAVGIWHLEDAHPRQRNAWHPPLKHFHPVRSWQRPNAPMCIAWQLSKTPWTSSASHAPMPGGPFPCVSMCRMPQPRNWGQLPTWARQVAGTHLHLPDLLPDHCNSSQTWLEGQSHSSCFRKLLLAQQSHIPAPLFPKSNMPTHERWAVCLSLDHTLHLHTGRVPENTFANTRDCTYSRARCPCGPPAPSSCSLPPNHCLLQCPSHAPTCPTLLASPLKTCSLPGDENCPPPSQIPFLALLLAVDPSTISAWQQTPWNNAPHPSHRSPLPPPHTGMPASPPHQMDLPPLLNLWVRYFHFVHSQSLCAIHCRVRRPTQFDRHSLFCLYSCRLCTHGRTAHPCLSKLSARLFLIQPQMLISHIVWHQKASSLHIGSTWNLCPFCVIQVLTKQSIPTTLYSIALWRKTLYHHHSKRLIPHLFYRLSHPLTVTKRSFNDARARTKTQKLCISITQTLCNDIMMPPIHQQLQPCYRQYLLH